jgi:hypothetical protein
MHHHRESSPLAFIDRLKEADVLLMQMIVTDKLKPPPIKDISSVVRSDMEMGMPLLPSRESKCDCLAFTRKMCICITL